MSEEKKDYTRIIKRARRRRKRANYLHIAGTVKNRNENTKLKQGV